MQNIKILMIPDLHLYDKDLPNTLGYAEQSLGILRSIKDHIIDRTREGKAYDLVILGGDIQHDQLTNIKYIGAFLKELREISEIVTEYTNINVGSRLDIQGKYHDIFYRNQKVSKLFSIKGQHDYGNSGYTFYDLLEDNNVITCPHTLIIGSTQISMYDFNNNLKSIRTSRQPGISNVIGIYHNPIKYGGIFIEKSGAINTELSPIDHQIYSEVDFAIMNDVHWNLNTQHIKTYNHTTTVVTPGSLGRTSNDEYHRRDTGNMVSITVDEVTREIDYEFIPIDLIPYKEFLTGIGEEESEEGNVHGGKVWDRESIERLLDRKSTSVPRALKSLVDKHYEGKVEIKPNDINILTSFNTWVKSGKELTPNQFNTCKKILKSKYISELVDISNKKI